MRLPVMPSLILGVPRGAAGPVRWAASPAGTLVVAAVVAAVCGVVVHRHGFVVLAAVGSTLAVGLVWPWASVRAVAGAVAFDADRGRVGEAAGYTVTVRNRWPVPVGGLTVGGPDGVVVRVPTVGPFATVRVGLSFVPGERGAYPRSAMRVGCGLPFGLWRAGRLAAVNRQLLVWPAAEATPLPAAVAAGGEDEIHGVRPYRRGDSLKLLHAAQSARHDRPIVRERAGGTRSAVRVAVDTAVASYTDGADRERAIRVAAGLLAAGRAAGVDVDAVIEGRVVRGGREAMDALARVGADGGPAAGDLLAVARGGGRAGVVVTSAAVARGLRQTRCAVVRIGESAEPGGARPVRSGWRRHTGANDGSVGRPSCGSQSF